MIFDNNQDNLNAWKTQMHMYQKNKRTKKPFGKTISEVQHVTHEQMKTKQCLFNPVLQTYKREKDEIQANNQMQQRRAQSLVNQLKQTMKHQKDFDIINLKSNNNYVQKLPDRKLAPIRNVYNVINNQKLPDFFFEKRQLRLPVERQKRLLQTHKKQFDIITGIYKENHQQKMQSQIEKQNQQITQKYWKTHGYDPVYGKFYDQSKEQQFQQKRTQQQQKHANNSNSKLPPSYIYRQPFIADYTKPLPEALQILDQRNANAKKRYQTKYIVLDQYQKRNLQYEDKNESILTNHVHFGRVLDQKAKQFDIITNNAHKQTRAQQLYRKKIPIKSWQQLQRQAFRHPNKALIKTGGFS